MQTCVSVIMSLYNTPADWLKAAMDSIIHQTYQDFEFIIFTDKPTDGSDKIVHEYAKKDQRIKLIDNKVNAGLTVNLFNAVLMSRGKYIARMDSDDIACLDRFAKQVKYLDMHSDVAVVGSMVNVFSDAGYSIGMDNLGSNSEITKIRMLFANSGVAHSSAMIRKEFLITKGINYNINFKKSQDYALWVDVLNKGGKIAVIPEILLDYRVHDNQISKKNNSEQNDCAKEIIRTQLIKLLPGLTSNEFNVHLAITNFTTHIKKKEYVSYIKKLIRTNNKVGLYERKAFKKEIFALWQKNIIKACKSGYLNFLFGILALRTFSPSIISYNIGKVKKRIRSSNILKKYLRQKKNLYE